MRAQRQFNMNWRAAPCTHLQRTGSMHACNTCVPQSLRLPWRAVLRANVWRGVDVFHIRTAFHCD